MSAAFHAAHAALVRGADLGSDLLAPRRDEAGRSRHPSRRVSVNVLRELECLLAILIGAAAGVDQVTHDGQRPASTALRRLAMPVHDRHRLRLALVRVGLQRRRLRHRGTVRRVTDPAAVCRLYARIAAELLAASRRAP